MDLSVISVRSEINSDRHHHLDGIPPLNEAAALAETAYQTYFKEEMLSNRGFDELYSQLFDSDAASLTGSGYTSEAALLFLLLHELNHLRPEAFGALGLSVTVPAEEGMSSRRAKRWQVELECDAVAVTAVLRSLANTLVESFDMGVEDAKQQAAKFAFAGADSALAVLAFIETRAGATQDVVEARTSRSGASHPPATHRRTVLSYLAYQHTTGRPHSELLAVPSYQPPEWKELAGHMASKMQPLDTILRSLLPSHGKTT